MKKRENNDMKLFTKIVLMILCCASFGYASARESIVLADFEGADYGGWTTEGGAFGRAPSKPSPNVVGSLGKGLVDTKRVATAENAHELMGMLTSPEFTLSRNYITFLIGGDSLAGVVSIYLYVDGKPVREMCGDQKWICLDRKVDLWACVMRKRGWDVREFAGRQAVIKIVDKNTGKSLLIDQIELDDQPAQPALRFAKIFADNMILQQQKSARVWGWATPGEEVAVTITEEASIAAPFLVKEVAPSSESYAVSVTYTERNAPAFVSQTKRCKADSKGYWEVSLEPMRAGFTPKYLVAQSAGSGIAIKNVLLGELWLCVGQSNMAWRSFHRERREVASADFPGVRYLNYNDSWHKPLDDIKVDVEWLICSPETADGFSAVPYLYGVFLHRYLKVPVGIITLARGGTTGQTWCRRDALDTIDTVVMKSVLKTHDTEVAAWDDIEQHAKDMTLIKETYFQRYLVNTQQRAAAKAAGKAIPELVGMPQTPTKDPRAGHSPPAGLFNGSVMPIKRLTIRGLLYYQGENQTLGTRWTRYEETFPRIAPSFRKTFGDDELPIGFIGQAGGMGPYGDDPELSVVRKGYQIVRDIQQRAVKNDPFSDFIAIYPTGDGAVHPMDKMPVAEYASLWALAKVYKKPLVHRGPLYDGMVKKGSSIHILFKADPLAGKAELPFAREGRRNAAIKGFIIAGEDQRWYPAQAREANLDGRRSIALSSKLVENPVAVRFGWAGWPVANLVGPDNLPVPTFRTDEWALPVGDDYTKEAARETNERLKKLQNVAEKQALDRKIRTMRSELSAMERAAGKR